jgi:hypothetical protein
MEMKQVINLSNLMPRCSYYDVVTKRMLNEQLHCLTNFLYTYIF